MKELGSKVLTKIQTLISEIDAPTKQQKNKKMKYTNNKQFQLIHDNYDNMKKEERYSKLSYGYLQYHKNRNSELIQDIYQEEKPQQLFKVTNKVTKSILSRSNLKPIYERIDDILENRRSYVKQIKKQYEDKQAESMYPLHKSIDQVLISNKKMNERELQFFRSQVDDKNHERIKKRHFKQLQYVKKEEKKFSLAVDPRSKSLSSKRNLKKNFSVNVFKRMVQDNQQRNRKKIQQQTKRRQEEGDFKPVLCMNSRLIAEKSKNKLTAMDQEAMYNSHSICKSHTSLVSHHSKSKQKKINTRPVNLYLNPKSKENTPQFVRKPDLSKSSFSRIKNKSTTQKSNKKLCETKEKDNCQISPSKQKKFISPCKTQTTNRLAARIYEKNEKMLNTQNKNRKVKENNH